MTSYTKFQLLRSGFNSNAKLLVTDSKKKLPKEVKYLAGQTAKFIKFLGTQVSVSYKNGKIYVPIQCLLAFEENVVITDPSKNDTIFAVHSRNPFFDIGAVFKTSVYTCGKDLVFNTNDNKRVVIDSSWAYALNPVVQPAKLEDLSKKFSVVSEKKPEIPVRLAHILSTPVKDVETVNTQVLNERDNPNSIYYYTSKDLNNFEIFKEDVDKHLSEVGEYYDVAGRTHKTLIACLKANQYLIDLAYANAVVDIVSVKLEQGKK